MSICPGTQVGISFRSGTPGRTTGWRKCPMPKTIRASTIVTRPTVTSVVLACSLPSVGRSRRENPAGAAKGRLPENDHPDNSDRARSSAPGRWIIANKQKHHDPEQQAGPARPRSWSQCSRPRRSTRRRRHRPRTCAMACTHGTRSWTNWGPKRCRAPKTAIGLAKHALLKATILSRPRASAIRLFAASIPITNSAMPAAAHRDHGAGTLGESGENGGVHG